MKFDAHDNFYFFLTAFQVSLSNVYLHGNRINAKLSSFSMSWKISNKIPTVINGLIIFGTRNRSSILFRPEQNIFQSTKRNASIHTTNWFVRKFEAQHVTPLGWALLVRIIYF